jgi:nitroreductase
MDVTQAIKQRRSIRRFKEQPIPRELIEQLLHAATLAPSAKNSQPWRFIVLQGEARDHLADLMLARVEELRSQGLNSGSAAYSARTIKQAPVTIIFIDTDMTAAEDHNGMGRVWSLVDTQSVTAALQTMILAAEEAGLGTLWICDVLLADQQIREWLGCEQEMVAALTLIYADEAPAPRARKPWQDVTEWR